MPVTLHAGELVRAAEAEVESLSPAAAMELLGDEEVVFVDVRDVRELNREPPLPGAFHCPRGMLEFWLDPESPYHQEELDEPARLVFYCRSGWRAVLAAATAQRMGRQPVANLAGGYRAWVEADGPVDHEFLRGKK